MSVFKIAGLPTINCCIAPLSILITVAALSSCTHKIRKAEQR